MADSRVWALLILVILKIAFSTSEETCKKINTCSCKLSNGRTIDLKPVDGTSTKPYFTGLKGGSGFTFDWNPCTPFEGGDLCTKDHVLVAQVGPGECYPAGTDDTSFSVDSTGNVVITYGGIVSGSGIVKVKRNQETVLLMTLASWEVDSTHYPKFEWAIRMRAKHYPLVWSSKITLKCDPKVTSEKGTWSDFGESHPEEGASLYSATYTSSHACATSSASSGGLSAGSTLLIIFFPLLLMYVIIGVLINRYGRGIQSMPELIPNHSFWADFPYLVKDGIVFTCGCIKGACSSLYRKCNKDGYAEI